MKRTLLSPPGILSLLAVVLAAGGVAYATIPSANGTIHACYSDTSGALRVVDGDAVGGGRCPDRETALTWNQKGPTGPAGADGATGLQGPAGPTGPAGGFKGIRTVKAFGKMSKATKKTVTASCASNEVAVGGGHQFIGSLTGRNVTISKPTGGSPATAWTVRARALAPIGNWRLRTFAVCAKL